MTSTMEINKKNNEEIKEGKIKESFTSWINENQEYFKKLTSGEKIQKYQENGAKIGKNFKLGKNSIVISKQIIIDDYSEIGENCYFKTDFLKIGKMVKLGSKINAVTRKIILGDVLFTGNNILIGGGGAYGPHARFEVGKLCFIGSSCLLNCGESIIIGDEVGLSIGVQIYTHNHWQSVLEGYFANFGPVIIEDKSYITGNVLIAPNVRIGEGSMVIANSTVIANVPKRSLVGGVPAKIIKNDFPRKLNLEHKDAIIKRLIEPLTEELKNKGIAVEKKEKDEMIILKTDYENKSIIYIKTGEDLKERGDIILTFDKSKIENKNICIFDLTNTHIEGEQNPLTDEIRNFLRKRGIKFSPIYWRYTADKGLYNDL